MQTIKKLLFLLLPNEYKSALILLILILIMAILQTIGIASILPFISVLTNPSLIDQNVLLNNFFETLSLFGVNTKKDFIFVLGFLTFVILISSLIFNAFTYYFQMRFLALREYSVSQRLVEGYLHQPYGWFLLNHSSNIGKTILSEVSIVISNGMRPMLELISKCIVFIFIISLIIIVNPKLALTTIIIVGGFYVLIFYFIRNYLDEIGNERVKSNQLRFKSVNEAFQAIKELKVRGLEEMYHKSFSNAAKNFSKTQALSSIFSQLPRYILEGIAFGGIILILLFIMKTTGDVNNALPIVTLYVFAGYRLMPTAQIIYASYTQLTFNKPAIDALYDQIKNLKSVNKKKIETTLSLNNEIALKNIHYNYPSSTKNVLTDINLKIPVKSFVGFVGTTGSGKTTTIDIILGLLTPNKGTLEVDGNMISDQKLKSWQLSVGYVPQNIFLFDDTVAANIAFETDYKKIDHDRIEEVSRIANIHNFVISDLPMQYQTKIGDRGIKLSGGQKQRLGIARALYHNPQVLILDEATSALDDQTEEIIQKNINILKKEITIIAIAHRLNTIKKCDIIYKFENGRIVDQGKYHDLFPESRG